jgi:uncharacterized membrane protein YbhN (UPF0104 family)
MYIGYMLTIALRFNFTLSSLIVHQFSWFYLTLVSWISAFFSTIMPGSVTGDVMKFTYFKGVPKKVIGFNILLDRLVGFCSIIYMASIAIIIGLIKGDRFLIDNKQLVYSMLGLAILATIGIAGFFFFRGHLKVWIGGWKIFHGIDFERMEFKFFVRSISVSLAAQACLLFIFYHLANKISQNSVQLVDIFVLAPIGLTLTAIPIAPLGIGVGHVAFGYLFQMIGLNNGASLFNFFICFCAVMNLLGAIPFLVLNKGRNNPQKE